MERAVRLMEFSEDEDSGEILDVGTSDTQWGRLHAIRHPMPKDTLWGSELILGTILESKKSTSFDKLNYCPTDKVLYSQTPPPPPPPPPPPSPIPTPPPPTLPFLFPRMIPEDDGDGDGDDEQEPQDSSLNKEIEEKMLEMNEKESRLSYTGSFTEGTMFDVVEKPVRTTVEHFKHEWLVSANDYSSMRLRKLRKDLNMGDNDGPDLTSGTYLDTISDLPARSETNIWYPPIAPLSRTQSDMSFHSDNN